MPLDSDVSNADALLHAEFYTNDKEGPWKGKPFVRIMIPGDKTSIFDQPAREDHKRRFQRQWLAYQMKSTDGHVIGTPLMLWHQDRPEEFTDSHLSELLILKFQTVEQFALATDGQIMRVGMGATGLRERAKAYLASKNAQARGAELEKAQSEIAELKQMVAALAAKQSNEPGPAEPRAPRVARARRGRKPGRKPRKEKVTVNEQHDNAPAGAAGL